METLKDIGDGQASKVYFPLELTKLVDGISAYMGSGNNVPEREVADRSDIEEAVGKADDVLGPIPTPDEIKFQMDELDREMDKDRKESEKLVKTSSSESDPENDF